jgi:hypothetical protein
MASFTWRASFCRRCTRNCTWVLCNSIRQGRPHGHVTAVRPQLSFGAWERRHRPLIRGGPP